MNKLILIIKREFLAKVRNRSFIVMTFLSPLLMVAMGALIFYLSKVNDDKVKNVAYMDQSGLFSSVDFKDEQLLKYINLNDLEEATAKKLVSEGNYYGLLVIPKKDSVELLAKSIQFFSNDAPNMMFVEALESRLSERLQKEKQKLLGIDVQKLEAAKISTEINLSNFSGEKSSKLINGIKIFLGMSAGYLIMMFIVIYGNSVMRSVIEEKTSRIIEVIISSVKPFYLMMGKIIGNASAGLLQFFIWTLLIVVFGFLFSMYTGVSFSEMQSAKMQPDQIEMINNIGGGEMQLIMQEVFNLPLLTMFVLFVFYFLGGYLLYSSIYAAIGAAVDSETDTQQFMLPVIIPLVLGVYVGFASVISDPHGPVSTAFSIIPLTSPIVMLMRIPFGVPWWEVLVSLALLLLTFLGVVWFAAKIYRVGILMYGKKPSYKELAKWLKY